MPDLILTDEILCKLAENGELRGINPKPQDDGTVFWQARLFVRASVVSVGTFSTPLDAINAVRHQANVEWSLNFSDAELFWKDGRVRVRGIAFSSTVLGDSWNVFLTQDRARYPVGSYPDLLSAINARDHAERMFGVQHYRDEFEKQVEKRVQERVAAYKAERDRETREKVRRRFQNKYNRKISTRNNSGVTGVCAHKSSGKWQAYINVDNRRKNLGLFDNFDEAVTARRQAERGIIDRGS